ncbi:monocyte differentiation antigen CD14 [Gastrophryne carolinensis]
MKTSNSFVLILLFVQRIPLADADCKYDKSLNHCSCILLDLSNIMTIITCNQASSFEFSGGIYMNTLEFTTYSVELEQVLNMVHIPLNKISFVNLVLSEEFLFNFLKWVQKIPINLLSFENTTFVSQYNGTVNARPPHISSMQFINVSSQPLTQTHSVFYAFEKWISTLGKLTVMRSHLKNIPCNVSLHFESLSYLDLSENLLEDENLSTLFCNYTFADLKVLKLRHNSLSRYETVCQTLHKYNLLMHLDLSENPFSSMSSGTCEWQTSLAYFNLSNTDLEKVTDGLPRNCEILDLSHNRIEFLNISLPRLRELYLSYNRITAIPTMGTLPRLQLLALDGNLISTVHRGQLQYFEHLTTFKGDNNPYTCSCSFVSEMKEITETDWIVQQWPEQYVCYSPESLRNKLVRDISHSFFECHTYLLIVLICIIILLLSIAILICFVKIYQSNKTRYQRSASSVSNSVRFHK